MVIEWKPGLPDELRAHYVRELEATVVPDVLPETWVTPVSRNLVPEAVQPWAERVVLFSDDIQLAALAYRPEPREVRVGGGVRLGGDRSSTTLMAGPCSVESEAQIRQAAELCVELGISVLRAGCYKPRTSPYSFQGLGLEGLRLLARMRDDYGLAIITEVKDHSHVQEVIEYADIVQIGAKAMYDHGILRACGHSRKPVLLKRGFGSTLQETVQAAEFILALGNPQVMLCERGIRTFEPKTRFTLDLGGALWLKYHTNLPVVLDPSHGIGHAWGVPDLARACMAAGIDGLLIEVHPTPKEALSDAAQQLDFDTFRALVPTLHTLGAAVGRVVR
jgi:3-deoxy-7-phosphoheptulonate synthase